MRCACSPSSARTCKLRVVIDVEQNPHAVAGPERAQSGAGAARSSTRARKARRPRSRSRKRSTRSRWSRCSSDRARPGNQVMTADFLGRPAPFPTAPWQLAAALKVPVVLCFGLYRGGNRYDLHFEPFADQLKLERARRDSRAAADRSSALPTGWRTTRAARRTIGSTSMTSGSADDSQTPAAAAGAATDAGAATLWPRRPRRSMLTR